MNGISTAASSTMAAGAMRVRLLVAIMVALWLSSGTAAAQFLPSLQARTPEEFDAYLDALASGEEAEARRFLSAYPESELRLPVWESIAERCRSRGDAGCAVKAARAGLALAPDYVPLLTLVASVEANVLARPGEASAARALELLASAKAPRTVPEAVWLNETARLRAENLAALAMAAYKTNHDAARAMALLEQSLNARAAAGNQYRLAMLYLEAGGAERKQKARALLEQAARSGEPAVASRAAEALQRLLQVR